MKSFGVLFGTLLLCLSIMGCSKDDDEKDSDCSDIALINEMAFITDPNAAYTISKLEITDDCLTITYNATGCDGESWDVTLIDSEEILSSNPPNRTLRLSFDNKEACTAVITKEIFFNLENLQLPGNMVELFFVNSSESILYQY